MFFDNPSNFIDYISNTYLNTHDSEFFLPYQIQFVYCTSSVKIKEKESWNCIGLHHFYHLLRRNEESLGRRK